MWLIHFLAILKIKNEKIDINSYYENMNFSEQISHFIASYYKLNPWEVIKWNVEKLYKTYSYILKIEKIKIKAIKESRRDRN